MPRHCTLERGEGRAFEPGTTGLSFFAAGFAKAPAGGDEARKQPRPPPHLLPSFLLSLSLLISPFAFFQNTHDSPPPKAFVSYERATGRPRGFGFVVFADPEVAARVVSQAHTIDRREVEAKRAVPKEEGGGPPPARSGAGAAAAAAAAALMLGSSPPPQQQRRHPQQPFEQQQQQLSFSSPPPPPLRPASQQALAASLPSNLDLAAESGSGEALLPQPPLPLPPQQQQPNRKLFVGGLPPSCDDASLRAHFEQFGPVDEAVVMVDHESKRSRG